MTSLKKSGSERDCALVFSDAKNENPTIRVMRKVFIESENWK